MRVSKTCIAIYEGHTQCADPLCDRVNTVHHGFMEVLKHAHLVCMSLSKHCITIYEGLNTLHSL